MIKVVCVLKSGGDYGPRHVYALQTMCRQWVQHEHEFVCLTDVPHLLDCQTVPLFTEAKGWWAKMELFRAFQGPTLFFDLDTIIRGPVSLDSLQSVPFAILRDFYRVGQNPAAMQSSMMWWNGDLSWIWQMWCERGPGTFRGDQDFIEMAWSEKSVAYFQEIEPGMACSFKAHIRDSKAPSSAPVVCFHGQPRPWDQTLVPYTWRCPVAPGSTVVVVGNGPGVLRQPLGRVIDAFDEVVRINAFQTVGHEAHTGRVTTLHATHGKAGGRRGAFACERTLWLHEHAAWECPDSWLVPKSFYWGLTMPWAADKSILPSAGFVTVAWLLDMGVPMVHLVGFDHFGKQRSKLHHYWDRQTRTQPKEHAPGREAAKFEQWRQQGRVLYL